METKELEQKVIETAQRVGDFLNERVFRYETLEWKSLDDPVTDLDKAAERMIREAFPDANFVGEEYGVSKIGSDVTLYIDPIDGTKSFVRGELLSSLSLAAEKNGELVVACVNDFSRGIMYVATKDEVYMTRTGWNGEKMPLPLHKKQLLSKATLTCKKVSETKKKFSDQQGFDFREQIASIALSMAHLAVGSHDGLILDPFKKKGQMYAADIAAGYFLMKQAGYVIKDYNLKEFDFRDPEHGIIALRPEIADKVLQVLGGAS